MASILFALSAGCFGAAVGLLFGRKNAAAEMAIWSPFVRHEIAIRHLTMDDARKRSIRFLVFPLAAFFAIAGVAVVIGAVSRI